MHLQGQPSPSVPAGCQTSRARCALHPFFSPPLLGMSSDASFAALEQFSGRVLPPPPLLPLTMVVGCVAGIYVVKRTAAFLKKMSTHHLELALSLEKVAAPLRASSFIDTDHVFLSSTSPHPPPLFDATYLLRIRFTRRMRKPTGLSRMPCQTMSTWCSNYKVIPGFLFHLSTLALTTHSIEPRKLCHSNSCLHGDGWPASRIWHAGTFSFAFVRAFIRHHSFFQSASPWSAVATRVWWRCGCVTLQ